MGLKITYGTLGDSHGTQGQGMHTEPDPPGAYGLRGSVHLWLRRMLIVDTFMYVAGKVPTGRMGLKITVSTLGDSHGRQGQGMHTEPDHPGAYGLRGSVHLWLRRMLIVDTLMYMWL
jgi:hypothetical protein